jgi:hypothetical protein
MRKLFLRSFVYCLLVGLLLPIGARSQSAQLPAVVNLAKAKELLKEYPTVLFSTLAQFPFDYSGKPAKPTPEAKIPEKVRALNGKSISIRGYMVPMDFADNGVHNFVIVPFGESCCFGVTLGAPNEWVAVEMAGNKRALFPGPDQIIVFGKLQVREVIKPGGTIESIYTMKAESMSIVGYSDELPWPQSAGSR